MGKLILPGRRGVQPPDGVGVDWNNPLTKDLGGLFDTRAGVELVYNNRASNYTTLLKAARAGVAADFSGTANQQYAHRPGYATTGAMTIFALMEIDALSNYGAVIAKQQTTTVNVPFEFRLAGSSPTGSDFNFVRASASSGANSKQTTGSRLSAAPGVPRAIAITVADGLLGTIPIAYVDKVKTSFNANSTAGSCTDSAQLVWIGRRYDGATQLDGRIYYVALWNRELSENEVGSLTDNPWQLYRPATRRIWVPVAGGGVDVTANGATITATASISAAGAASAVQSPTVVGQVLSATASLIAGVASAAANATVAGVTLAVTATLQAGAASATGAATVAGQVLTAAASIISGVASAVANVSASGATLTATASLIPGEAYVQAAGGGSGGWPKIGMKLSLGM